VVSRVSGFASGAAQDRSDPCDDAGSFRGGFRRQTARRAHRHHGIRDVGGRPVSNSQPCQRATRREHLRLQGKLSVSNRTGSLAEGHLSECSLRRGRRIWVSAGMVRVRRSATSMCCAITGELFGPVASAATCWRPLDEIGGRQLRRIARARAGTRPPMRTARPGTAGRAAGRDVGDGAVVLDVDSTIVLTHSDKEGAALTYKNSPSGSIRSWSPAGTPANSSPSSCGRATPARTPPPTTFRFLAEAFAQIPTAVLRFADRPADAPPHPGHPGHQPRPTGVRSQFGQELIHPSVERTAPRPSPRRFCGSGGDVRVQYRRRPPTPPRPVELFRGDGRVGVGRCAR
jgi:hypothetical protein